MSHKFQKPTFQSSSKNFRERNQNERQNDGEFERRRPAKFGKQDKKFSEKSPLFRDRNERQPVTERKISELTLKKARNGENVRVTIKSTGESDQPRVKKTGPLSPRAPEKIKKNRSEEMKVYGENACLALFAQRPESIVRVWATVQMSHKIGEMFSYLAQNKKAYHVVDSEELALVSGTEHHGGICMLVKKSRPFTLQGYLDIPHQQDCLVLLDGVRNAQNIGGILRTCAFFGVKNVVLDDAEIVNSSTAMRIAEGGAEHIRILQHFDIEQAVKMLRTAGYQVVHIAQSKQGTPLDQLKLSDKVVFIFSETSSQSLAENTDSQVQLSFSNPLKNGLNVAVNAGILLGKWYFR